MKTIFSWGMLLLSAVLVLISQPPAAGRHFRVRRGTATAKTVRGARWHHGGDRQAGRARQENSSMNPADRSNHARDRPAQEVAAALYKLVVEQLPDAVIVSDRHGVIETWNRAAETLFGFAAGEAIGQSLDIIIPERFRQAHWEAFHQAVANGRTRLGSQVRTTRSTHKQGHKMYVDLSFGLVTDASGTVVGATAVARDCTARFEADKALRKRVAELEAGTS